eukprot:1954108-Prymnesium_polylepis.1
MNCTTCSRWDWFIVPAPAKKSRRPSMSGRNLCSSALMAATHRRRSARASTDDATIGTDSCEVAAPREGQLWHGYSQVTRSDLDQLW